MLAYAANIDQLSNLGSMVERIATNGARLFELIEALLGAALERNQHGATVDVSDVVLQAVASACGGNGPVPAS